MRAEAVIIAFLLATPVHAEVRAIPDRADARVAQLHFAGSEPLRLEVPLDGPVTILLPPSEQITAITIARVDAWQASAEQESGSFTIRALRPGTDTDMTVITSARTYHFMLSASATAALPRLVRITGVPRPGRHSVETASNPRAGYKLSGNRELWPSAIRDDGMKMYLEWSADQAIPAVFALDRLGREEMVNGYMRGTVFTIDRVHEQLLFRIDKASAAALRQKVKRTG